MMGQQVLTLGLSGEGICPLLINKLLQLSRLSPRGRRMLAAYSTHEAPVMAMNRIQCQPGLALPTFLAQFGTEAPCAAALESARWPHGFRCPGCGHAEHDLLQGSPHQVFQCHNCRRQTSKEHRKRLVQLTAIESRQRANLAVRLYGDTAPVMA